MVEKNEFNVDCTFDNQLMIEIFSGKLAVFHDEAMLFIEAARVGRTNILESMLEVNPDLDIKADDSKKVMADKHISQNIRLPAKNLNFYAVNRQIKWEIRFSAITFLESSAFKIYSMIQRSVNNVESN